MESSTNPCRQWYLLLATTASTGLRLLYLWIVQLYQYLTQKFNQDWLQKQQNTWAGRKLKSKCFAEELKSTSRSTANLQQKNIVTYIRIVKSHATIILWTYWVLHSFSRLDNSTCFFLVKRHCTLMLGRRWKREIYLYTIAFWMHFKESCCFQS